MKNKKTIKTLKPKILEKDITAQIRNYLKLKGILHYKAWQGLGSTKGLPDIVGVLPGGKALYIEVKTEAGRLSPHQEKFLNNLELAGAMAFVARSVEDVMHRLSINESVV